MNDLKCVECNQSENPMIVFVGTMRYEDGTIEDLPEGMYPYCDPCREKLNIEDELNAGLDLRAESKQVVLGAVASAKAEADVSIGLDSIFEIDDWVGGSDGLFQMLGRAAPPRPQSVFDGVSDAFLEIDPTQLEFTHIIGLLSVTLPIKDRISGRSTFFSRARDHMTLVDPDRVDKLLGDLE